jgi:hypothetical protein
MVYQHFDCINFYVINQFVPPSLPKNYYAKGLNVHHDAQADRDIHQTG